MRVSDYSPDTQQEIQEVWAQLGTWLRSVVPGKTGEMAGGEKEMTAYANDFSNKMLKVAGRYKDQDDKPITRNTLNQLPARAPYLFMKGIMKLNDGDIQNILKALAANKKLKLATPPGLTPAKLKDSDETIQDIWGVADGKTAEIMIDKLISIAAIRKMEIDYLSDPEHRDQTAGGATPQGSAATAGGATSQGSAATAGGATPQGSAAASSANLQSSYTKIAAAQQALAQLGGIA